jgi:hypothetical protein
MLKVTTASSQGLFGSWLIDPQDFTVAASGGDITGATLSSELGTTSVTLQSSSGSKSGSGNVNVNDVGRVERQYDADADRLEQRQRECEHHGEGRGRGPRHQPQHRERVRTAAGKRNGRVQSGIGCDFRSTCANVSPTST